MEAHEPAIIVLDTGTTSMRAALFDAAGQVLHVARRDNPPRYYPDGRVEQNPETWKHCLFSLLREAQERAKAESLTVSALSLTSQRSSVIPLDKDGRPLHDALMWQDIRTDPMCAAMKEAEPEVYRRCGLRITSVFSAIKMRWFKIERPEIYRQTWKMAGIQDYLLFLLTGRLITDRSLASRTNLFDLERRDWSDELIARFGVDRSLLCDLIDPGSTAGLLSRDAAEATGIPASVPVISAGGDQQCAALGLGLLDTDTIIVNTGTGAYAIGLSNNPVHDPAMRIYCNVYALPSLYITEAQMLTAGVLYRWFRDQFYAPPDPHEEPFARINREILASPPGARGVILLPHFKGAAAPYWNPRAKGHFLNLDLSTTRGDMARAILEGIALDLAEIVALLEEASGQARQVLLSGGLTAIDEFVQICADSFARPVEKSRDCEATALGAWISAATAIGLFSSCREAHTQAVAKTPKQRVLPDSERMAIYQKARKERKKLYAALAAIPPEETG
ncbi:MAG: FGGY family carbohydrate kinase [Rectinema sp.]|nr:FGGY family carbohydrate kinase [Rectinema sp.]